MLLGLPSVLTAHAYVIDQSQTDNSAATAGFAQTDLAQSFEPADVTSTGAELSLYADDTGPGDITISLYDNLPNNGGTLLASGTDPGVPSGGEAVVHWSAVDVIPNTTYYLVFTSTNEDMTVGGDDPGTYPRGNTFANPGYESFPTLDYAFETFAVPEPGSLALGGFGLACLAGLALRRRLSGA